jgi:hypothetical protein
MTDPADESEELAEAVAHLTMWASRLEEIHPLGHGGAKGIRRLLSALSDRDKRIKALEEGLRPFAKELPAPFIGTHDTDQVWLKPWPTSYLNDTPIYAGQRVGDFRRARSLLKSTPESMGNADG